MGDGARHHPDEQGPRAQACDDRVLRASVAVLRAHGRGGWTDLDPAVRELGTRSRSDARRAEHYLPCEAVARKLSAPAIVVRYRSAHREARTMTTRTLKACALLLLCLLPGCAAQIAERDDARCRSYGAAPGTD